MKIETYKIKGWKEKLYGLVIDENDKWILVKHIPVDYVIDGFILYRKKFIKIRKPHKKAEIIAKVLKLKEIKIEKPQDFEFKDVLELLKWSENKYGLFEFKDNLENELFYGKVSNNAKNLLTIDMILSNGNIEKEYDYEFELGQIRTIAFESDYFTSIVLLMNNYTN